MNNLLVSKSYVPTNWKYFLLEVVHDKAVYLFFKNSNVKLWWISQWLFLRMKLFIFRKEGIRYGLIREGVPDCMAPIELPRASVSSDRSMWAPCGWSWTMVAFWALHAFLGTKSETVLQNLPCRGVTSCLSQNREAKIEWKKWEKFATELISHSLCR